MRSLATGLLTHPWRVVTTLLAPSGLAYLVKLLWPFGFTSLASPLTFLISLPELLINLLSSKPQQHSVAYHYVAAEAPFVIAAMVLGLRRISGWFARGSGKTRKGGPHRLHRLLAGAVVAVALLATLDRRPALRRAPGVGAGADARAPRRHRRGAGEGAGGRQRLGRQALGGPALGAGAHHHVPADRRGGVRGARQPGPLRRPGGRGP